VCTCDPLGEGSGVDSPATASIHRGRRRSTADGVHSPRTASIHRRRHRSTADGIARPRTASIHRRRLRVGGAGAGAGMHFSPDHPAAAGRWRYERLGGAYLTRAPAPRGALSRFGRPRRPPNLYFAANHPRWPGHWRRKHGGHAYVRQGTVQVRWFAANYRARDAMGIAEVLGARRHMARARGNRTRARPRRQSRRARSRVRSRVRSRGPRPEPCPGPCPGLRPGPCPGLRPEPRRSRARKRAQTAGWG
jgi:hypothetical protein